MAANNEFIVEKILDKRVKNNRTEYLLSWKGKAEKAWFCTLLKLDSLLGFGPDENSWEPKDNLGCPDMIKAFEDRLKSGGGGRRSTEAGNRKHAGDAPRGFDRGLEGTVLKVF